MPQADRLHAAHQAFGGLQRDSAHAPFADMLLDFANDIDGLRRVETLARHADGGVNQRDLPLGKLAVHGRAGHLHHFADYSSVTRCHTVSYSAAAAPLTTSMI